MRTKCLILSCLVFLTTIPRLYAHDESKDNYVSIEFVNNRGQWDGPFSYKAITKNADIYFEQGGFTYVIGAADNPAKKTAAKHGWEKGPFTLNYHAYKVRFEGAAEPEITGSKPLPHYYNYFLGKDSSRWKSGIHPVLALDYKELYPGIDLHIASENSRLKYDFILQPGADAGTIKLRFEGTDGISIRDNKLVIATSLGAVEEMKPYAFQVILGVKKEVRCQYKIRGNNLVGYSFPLGYDESQILVIDPVVEFSTFTGSTNDNWGNSATYDNQGNFYAGGTVSNDRTGGSYPVTSGAFQRTFGGGGPGAVPPAGGGNLGFPCDMAITKFNADGSALLFSTYIGGSQNEQPHSMMVDKDNNLVIAGRTYSNNFPVHPLGYDTIHNGNSDFVVLKLNDAGTALLGSTYIGGSGDDGVNVDANWYTFNTVKHSYADDGRSEVILDKQGNIYIAGPSQSSNFPLNNATQNTLSGPQDGVVFKLDSNLRNLTWSTYLGGSGYDAAYVLALDTAETHLYVAGGTASSNFPSLPGGVWPTYQGGSTDGFIVKFENSGLYPRIRSTFIGRNNYDQCFGIQVDMEDNVYVTGNTLGGTFPVSSGTYSNPASSQFVMKLNSDLSTNIYSTVFGSGNPNAINITPVAFMVDTCQNVYVSGWGGDLASPGSNTNGMPITSSPNPAFQPTTDGNDFYFIALSKNALSLLYGSYFGGTGIGEHVDGGTSRFDKNGVVYQSICAGCTGSSAVPTTPGAYSRVNGSSNCNLMAVKIAFNLGAVKAVADAEPNAKGCLPFTVNFGNTSTNATSFSWDFDDGSPSDTQRTPSHTFTTPGIHNVRMVAYNPNACKVWDTVYLQITVDTNIMNGNFDYVIVDSCDPFRVSFLNTSVFSNTPGASSFTRFDWFLGDGNSFTGNNPPVHDYSGPGTYTVTMVMHDSTACNNPDTVQKTFEIREPLVKVGWDVPDSICIDDAILFRDSSVNATDVLWSFGDGQSSTERNPSHHFAQPGVYLIKLIAYNPASCNKADSLWKTVLIKEKPTALFEFAPRIPETNKPITFTNRSINAATYLWDFGDQTTSEERNPVHLYKSTDNRFRVCLVARSLEGCTDTICRYVDSDIRPLVDVPSGFSPNGDGSNDILYVRGGAIERIHFRIFNRWGEMIFESHDLAVGWDGTYKGKEQEMEVYAYTLTAFFTNGTSTSKQGNVTLLR